MSEREFADAVQLALAYRGRRVLRVCDYTEGRRGVFGLRAISLPLIQSSGADYLVLPGDGMPVVLVRSMDDVLRGEADSTGDAFFLELKDPKAKKRSQEEQEKWIRWVEAIR